MPQPSKNLPEREFAKLLVQHQPRLMLFIRSFVFKRSDVDDLVQEVAAKAWEQLPSYDTARPFDSWLFAIAKYEVLSYIRDRKRDRLVFGEAVVEKLAGTLDEMSQAQQLPQLEALELCLSRVPSDDRELLRQRFELNKSGQAIAKTLHISGATVSRRLQRVYGQLLLCVRGQLRDEARA